MLKQKIDTKDDLIEALRDGYQYGKLEQAILSKQERDIAYHQGYCDAVSQYASDDNWLSALAALDVAKRTNALGRKMMGEE